MQKKNKQGKLFSLLEDMVMLSNRVLIRCSLTLLCVNKTDWLSHKTKNKIKNIRLPHLELV